MVATDHHVTVLECQRISVGRFERGPIHFLIEEHDKIAIPQACLDYEPEYDDFRVLRRLWLDDAELVQYLSESLGLPTLLGQFAFTRTPTDSVHGRTWTWKEPGQPESEIIYSRLETIPGGSASTARLVWHNGSAVTLMDFTEDEKRPAVSTLNTVVRLHPPMMHAVPEAEVYTGVYSLVDSGDYSGQIYRFGDLKCERPLP
jgi:hypothetical protein